MDQRPIPAAGEVVARTTHVSKRFAATVALDDVSLEVCSGEVHALVGENGSGKSTLVKMLTGYHIPEPGGRVEIGGTAVEGLLSPQEASELGIAVVHQTSTLIGELSVAENLSLERGYAVRRWRIDWGEETRRAMSELGRLGLQIDPDALAGDLDPTTATLVQIARALARALGRGRVLVLDEPTASLPAREVGRLFDVVRGLRDEGVGVLYISHRLDEVFALADRITVLRNGRVAWSGATVDIDVAGLVEAITGHEPVGRDAFPVAPARGQPRLAAQELVGTGVHEVSFQLAAGEVLGVTGMLGSGASPLGQLLAGVVAIGSGTLQLDGAPARFAEPVDAIKRGVLYVGKDRHASALFSGLTVGENLATGNLDRLSAWGRVQANREAAFVATQIADLDIRPANPDESVVVLSGGNQQKVVLGRWLGRQPRVLVVDEPTQGVDVGARATIHDRLVTTAREGAGVVLISTDVKELIQVCDRVMIMRGGRVTGTCSGAHLTEATVTAMVHHEPEPA